MNRERIGRGDEARKWRSAAAVSALLALSTLSACTAESTMQSAQSEAVAQSANTATSAPAKPAVAAPQAETPEKEEIERVPLRDWKGLEILDNLPSDRTEKIHNVREFIMLNDPECNLTQDYISINTVQGGFTRIGDELVKAFNVVGAVAGDKTIDDHFYKADLLIEGLVHEQSPTAMKEMKSFFYQTFLAGELDLCSPEACNHRFDGTEVTQTSDQLMPIDIEEGDKQQGYDLVMKLQPVHKDIEPAVDQSLRQPSIKFTVNVGGIITGFEKIN